MKYKYNLSSQLRIKKRISFTMLTIVVTCIISFTLFHMRHESNTYRIICVLIDIYMFLLLIDALIQAVYCDPGFYCQLS